MPDSHGMPAWLQMDTDVSVSSGSAGRSSILKQFGGALRAETNDGLARLTVALMKDSSEAPGGREPKWLHCQVRVVTELGGHYDVSFCCPGLPVQLWTRESAKAI